MESSKVDFGYFHCVAFEDIFKRTLANYLEFAEKALQLPPPLRIIAGAVRVEGYRMTRPLVCPLADSNDTVAESSSHI